MVKPLILVGKVVGVAAALATLDLYAELGLWDRAKRLYVETVMTETIYIGGAKSLGVTVHALSRDGDWCGKHLVLRMTRTESRDMFSKDSPELYLKRLGERLHEEEFCPKARSAEVYGYAEKGGDLLFRGTSSAAVSWAQWDWEGG